MCVVGVLDVTSNKVTLTGGIQHNSSHTQNGENIAETQSSCNSVFFF